MAGFQVLKYGQAKLSLERRCSHLQLPRDGQSIATMHNLRSQPAAEALGIPFYATLFAAVASATDQGANRTVGGGRRRRDERAALRAQASCDRSAFGGAFLWNLGRDRVCSLFFERLSGLEAPATGQCFFRGFRLGISLFTL